MNYKIHIKRNTFFLNIFIVLYPILPTYFSLNISNALPLVTGSRLLLILLFIYCLLKKNKHDHRSSAVNNCEKKVRFSLCLFIVCEIFVFFPYALNSASIKELFVSLVEKALYFYCIVTCVNSKKRVISLLKILTYVVLVSSVFAIIESILGINIAHLLNISSRELNVDSYMRLGRIRSEFSFGHPLCYATYLILMMPFVFYFYGKDTGYTKYLKIFLPIVALFLTISRGIIVVFLITISILLFTEKGKARKKYMTIFLAIGGFGVLLYLFIPDLQIIINNIIASTLSDFGFSNAKVSSSQWGTNIYGLLSRVQQYEAISYIFPDKILWGGGADFIFRNELFVSSINTGTRHLTSIDNMYISWLLNKGLIGFIGNVTIYITMLTIAAKKTDVHELRVYNKLFFVGFLGYILSMMTVCELTTERILWTMFSLFVALQLCDKDDFYKKEKLVYLDEG